LPVKMSKRWKTLLNWLNNQRPDALEHWHWLKSKIRCALDANDPGLIGRFMAEGARLVRQGRLSSWYAASISFRLLIDTAHDPALPWHWRCLCLDYAFAPLATLAAKAQTPAEQQQIDGFTWQLSKPLAPSLPYLELLSKDHD